MLCSKIHYQMGFNFIPFACEVLKPTRTAGTSVRKNKDGTPAGVAHLHVYDTYPSSSSSSFFLSFSFSLLFFSLDTRISFCSLTTLTTFHVYDT